MGRDFLSNILNVEFKGYDDGLSTLYQVGLFCKWVIKGTNNEKWLNVSYP